VTAPIKLKGKTFKGMILAMRKVKAKKPTDAAHQHKTPAQKTRKSLSEQCT